MTTRAAIAMLRQPKRLWAIPAVHAMVHRLSPVADIIAERLEPGDAVVFLGNLIGGSHGNEAADVVTTLDLALALRRRALALPGARACDVAFLRGTQEEMWTKLEQLHFAQSPRDVLHWMLQHGLAGSITAYGGAGAIAEGERAVRDGPMATARWIGGLRQALRSRPGHAEWLAAVRRAALSDDGHLLAVHHGIDTLKPLDLQGDAFWWGGSTPFEVIDAPYGDIGRMVRGFDRTHPGVVDREHTLTIDAGCGFGGPLLVALLDSRGKVLEVVGDEC
jgi:serine/threonine protein phosphatase 1